MGKRSSEDGQLSKEEYEEKLSQNTPNAAGSFLRASSESLQQRRIISVSKSREAKASNDSTKTSSTTTPDQGSSNPFASVKFNFNTSATTGSSFSFQSTPSFSFGSTKASSQASSQSKDANPTPFGGFSFPKPSVEIRTNAGTQGGSGKSMKQQQDQKLQELKKVFSSKMRERFATRSNGGVLDDIQCFLGYYSAIVNTGEGPSNDNEAVKKQPEISTLTSAKPFSFGLTVPTASVSGQSMVPNSMNDDAVPSEPPVAVEEVSDPDWTTVHKVAKVKFFVDNDRKWNSVASGPLRVERHNSKPKSSRIVIRDGTTGKVLLNCSIPSGGKFTPQIAKNKYFITFFSQRAEDDKTKMFMLQTHASHHAKLLEILTDLSK